MRALGLILIAAAIVVGLPSLFLESWLGDAISIACVATMPVGAFLLFRPLTRSERATPAAREDIKATLFMACAVVALVAVTIAIVRYTAV